VTRVAAVDCGTNTIKLLVADLDAENGTERELVREMRMVRLGQDVDRTGRLADEALARTFAATDEYAAIVAEHQVHAIRFCATSAVRDASNADDFADGISKRLGVSPQVVTGPEEAQLSYDGATRKLGGRGLPTPFLVVDIGGGSTELILGDGHGHVRSSVSLDVGSVRMTERHLRSDPPTPAEVDEARRDIAEVVGRADVPVAEAGTVVGVAGTITTVAAGVLGLEEYDRAAIDQSVLALPDVHSTTEALLGMTVAERKALTYMHPGRADVIGAGALILDEVLHRTRVPSLLVSEADILDGIAWSLV
jgi:exopolyphosphatase/guanosine-5'-triphosphate,3'-diphosphate pyrophosphatase